MSSLSEFSKLTTLVADTADIEAIRKYRPQDATTNPSLILKNAGGLSFDLSIPDSGKKFIAEGGMDEADAHYIETAVNMGIEILEIIPGRVSTEVPSRYSFHTDKTVGLARYIISRYREQGVDSKRILIKIASTWEGIEAGRILEQEGIHCNMTLLFSLAQAIACAQAGVTLVSPFVGRVFDWYQGRGQLPPGEDPGVDLVRDIYCYFKKFDYPVEIMGASFRTLKQVLALAGCDLLTISPALLGELEGYKGEVVPQLVVEKAKASSLVKRSIDRDTFSWEICSDPMASEKLSEGIRLFHQDFLKLNNFFLKKN